MDSVRLRNLRILVWDGLPSQRPWLLRWLLLRPRLSKLLRALQRQRGLRVSLPLASKFKTRMRSKMKREMFISHHRLLDFQLKVIFNGLVGIYKPQSLWHPMSLSRMPTLYQPHSRLHALKHRQHSLKHRLTRNVWMPCQGSSRLLVVWLGPTRLLIRIGFVARLRGRLLKTHVVIASV